MATAPALHQHLQGRAISTFSIFFKDKYGSDISQDLLHQNNAPAPAYQQHLQGQAAILILLSSPPKLTSLCPVSAPAYHHQPQGQTSILHHPASIQNLFSVVTTVSVQVRVWPLV
ncbi:hypothetical protein NQD34_013006 [Periophthalmus magnuspinnatus]|nr:hypothetical protein NQD34_013006 [Periophthalmus magnuspinnatus]